MPMLLKKIRAYLDLMRFIVCLSAFLMAIMGYWLATHTFDLSNSKAFWAAGAVGLALAFGNALNDILDLEADKVNYPNRPLPSGAISPTEAGWVTAFFLVSSMLCGIMAGRWVFYFIVFELGAAVLYDVWASKIPVLGKVVVAVCSALTLSTGFFVSEGGDLPIVPILAAFFFILAREFTETISDAVGDRIAGRRSIYALLGKTRVLLLSLMLILISIVVLFIPVFTAQLASRTLYILTIVLLLIIPAAMTIIVIWRDQSAPNIRQASHWIGVVFFSSFLALLWLV
jgi:4-hydroxybenzoate polyprenyltransferase